MIVGAVNASREAIISVGVRGPTGTELRIEAVVDTGFNDDLTLPPELILEIGLPYASPAQATLADGRTIEADYFRAAVLWEGHARHVLVLELPGAPLVGMGLLNGHRLTLDAVPAGRITIEPLPA